MHKHKLGDFFINSCHYECLPGFKSHVDDNFHTEYINSSGNAPDMYLSLEWGSG
jgi:hypothetical protein